MLVYISKNKTQGSSNSSSTAALQNIALKSFPYDINKQLYGTVQTCT
jgi:hypothetical protein